MTDDTARTAGPEARPMAYGTRPIKVTILGLRGCPDVQGGVERHVEQLAPRLALHGCDVEVIVRKPYVTPKTPSRWKGIALRPIPCPTHKATEAAVHTFLGVLHAGLRRRPDVLHIHAVGPGLMVPLARLLGLRVVVTHHGYDYDRDKWGTAAKAMLRLGEWFGMRLSHKAIGVSRAISKAMSEKHGADIAAVPNGVNLPEPVEMDAVLAEFGLTHDRYVVTVGRIVPEKRHLDLIAAFDKAKLPGWKLVIVGAADHPDAYSRSVEDRAAKTDNVVMTGFRKGAELSALFAGAGLFVLPSTHEGLPIALLEALSYGLPAIASDIEANLEVGLAPEDYYPVTDVERLAALIAANAGHGLSTAAREERRTFVTRNFSWDRVALRTIDTYRQAMGLDIRPEEVRRPDDDRLPPIAGHARTEVTATAAE